MNRNDTYICHQRFSAPFETVWDLLTDPMRFPRVYPSWVAKITPSGERYLVVDPSGEQFSLIPITAKDYGVVDFKIIDAQGHVEIARSRIFRLRTGGCILVHVAVRWEGCDDATWEAYKRDIDKDLKNAHAVVEAEMKKGS